MLHAFVHVRVELRRMIAVEVAVVIMVAHHENLLDGATIGITVVREHGVPRLRNSLHLFDHAVVGHVAGDHHGIDVLAAEPFERMPEGEVVAPCLHLLVGTDFGDVDVRDHAEPELGRTPRRVVGATEEAAAAECAERRRTADEELPS